MTAVRLAVTLLFATVFLAVRSSKPIFRKRSRHFSLSEPSSFAGILSRKKPKSDSDESVRQFRVLPWPLTATATTQMVLVYR